MRIKRTTETVKKEIFDKFGDKIYTTENFVFRGVDYKETFICKDHGEFITSYYCLVKSTKYGCPLCSPYGPKGWEYMKNKLFEKHGNKYEYHLNSSDYTSGQKLKIICRKHGVFEQTYSDHLSGCGCPICYKERHELTINDFLLGAISKHGNLYNYIYVFEDFINSKSKIRIICEKHGIFIQNANDHRSGVGCPSCKTNSKGENIIRNFLIREGIEFTTQKTFPDCVLHKGKLKYDFYLPKFNMLIEYDGIQHFEETLFNTNLEYSKEVDEYKTNYASKNGFTFLRIKYNQNILKVLGESIGI